VDTADGVLIRVEVGSSRGVLAETMRITISIRCARGGAGAAIPPNRGLKATFKNIAKYKGYGGLNPVQAAAARDA
jgi:hypothetical protein